MALLASMHQSVSNVSLIAPTAGMFDSWYDCYERYARDCGGAPDRRQAGILWRWLLDGTYRVAGVLAIDPQKRVCGFAHYRPFPNTLDGTESCALDDLYVIDAYRGSGIEERLIDSVCSVARKRGWSEVRWMANASNESARAIYERLAAPLDLLTYRIRF